MLRLKCPECGTISWFSPTCKKCGYPNKGLSQANKVQLRPAVVGNMPFGGLTSYHKQDYSGIGINPAVSAGSVVVSPFDDYSGQDDYQDNYSSDLQEFDLGEGDPGDYSQQDSGDSSNWSE